MAKVKSWQLVDSVPDGCGHVDAVNMMSGMEATINCERKRVRETRVALVQQLVESEALEMKHNLLVS